MKFDSKTIPAINFLEQNSLQGAIILQPGSETEIKMKMDLMKLHNPNAKGISLLPQVSKEEREKFELIWKYYTPKFRHHIFALTAPFLDKMKAPVMKFSENFDVKGYGTISGSFLWKKELHCFYLNEKLKELVLFMFGHNSLDTFLYKGPNTESYYYYNAGRPNESYERFYTLDAFFQCAAMHYFALNSQIGRIELSPKERKPSTLTQHKLTNLTNLKLTYLDAKWDNDIYSFNPFTVNGHERMQPFGERRSEVKKIWISSYMKNGYSSKAGLTKYLENCENG